MRKTPDRPSIPPEKLVRAMRDYRRPTDPLGASVNGAVEFDLLSVCRHAAARCEPIRQPSRMLTKRLHSGLGGKC